MLRAISYCRVSTEEQAEDGHHSLAAQESLCKRAATDHGYEVVAVFCDPGKSATNMNRPALQDALARCQSDHSIKALFVQDTDRLARNTQDHLTIRALLQKHEVKLHSVSQPMLEESAEGMMIDTIIASVNQFQSDITARKTMKGLEEKVRNGGWPAIAPIGYKNIGTGPEGQTRIVVINPVSAPLVQKLFRLYATGNYSMQQLNGMLYREGLRSHTGKKLQESKISYMLQNRFYVGEVRWGEIVSHGQHEPLIDEALFQTVKSVMQAHNGNRSRMRRHDFLLRGFVFCGGCGKRLIGEKHILKRVEYYRCHRRGGCQPLVSAAQLEADVEAAFSHLRIPLGMSELTIKALQDRAMTRKNIFDKERLGILKRKAVVDAKLTKLEAKWLDAIIDDADFKRLRDLLKEQQLGFDNQLADLESKKTMNFDAVAEVVQFTRDLSKSYLALPTHLKRQLLRFAWERFEVTNKEIVRAVPTRIFQNFHESSEFRQETQKPVQNERAFVHKGGRHPTGRPRTSNLVRLSTQWGPKRTHNRPEKPSKVASVSNISSLMELIDSDPSYVRHVLALYAEIRDGITAWKAGTSYSEPPRADTKPIAQ